MPNVRRITVQLQPPKDDFPGQVAEGWYIVDDGQLIMTSADGKPVHATEFRHILEPHDNPAAIAMMLTRKVRRHLLGQSETQEKFFRRLEYPKTGVA